MKAPIAFIVKRRFPLPVYRELVEKGFEHKGDLWLVPLKKINDFERITGLALEIELEDYRIITSLLGEPQTVEAKISRKGVSEEPLEIIEGEGVYHVKLSDGKSPFTIPVSIVDAYFEVIKELKANGVKRVKKRELVERALRKLNLRQYFTKDGSHFHWEAFYGDRVRYHTHYYVPAKILDAKGLIKVTKHDDVIIL